MSGQALRDPFEGIPLVLGALREALGQLESQRPSDALLVRIEALASLLPGSAPVPEDLRDLAQHLGAFGQFLKRSLSAPETLAHLAGPTGELCLAWQITAETLAPSIDGFY